MGEAVAGAEGPALHWGQFVTRVCLHRMGAGPGFSRGKDLTSSCPLSLPDTHLATAQVLKGALGAAERQAPVQPPNPPQCVWGWACASGAQTGTQAGGKQVGG